MAASREKAPAWFWVVSVVLFVWAIAGVASCYLHVTLDKAALDKMTAYDRNLFLGLPRWFAYDFALATITALVGSICLLLRRRVAMPLYLLSLIGVIIQFGWVLGATDLIAVKGIVAAALFPFVIFSIGVFSLWFADVARGRRWIV